MTALTYFFIFLALIALIGVAVFFVGSTFAPPLTSDSHPMLKIR